MSANLNELLKSKMINGWNLFWLITAPISLVMVLTMIRLDLSSAEGVSSMIQLSESAAGARGALAQELPDHYGARVTNAGSRLWQDSCIKPGAGRPDCPDY